MNGANLVNRAVGTLVLRSRITAVGVVVSWVAITLGFASLFGIAPQAFLQDVPSLTLLALVVIIGLLLAAGPLVNAGALRKAGATLRGLPNLKVIKRRGFLVPRLTCEARLTPSSFPAVTIDFFGGLVGEGFAESPEFRLSLPWECPVDVLAYQRWAYSDLRRLIDDVDRVRQTLHGSEIMWTNMGKKRIESTIEPGWGRIGKRDEPAEVLGQRLIDRWQSMERIHARAADEREFGPILLPAEAPLPAMIASFQSALWCPSCNRRVRTWSFERRTCRRCGGPAVYLMFREPWNSLGNWLRTKMGRVRERYGF